MLLPQPYEISFRENNFKLDDRFSIQIVGHQNDDLNHYVESFYQRLIQRTSIILDQKQWGGESAPTCQTCVIKIDETETLSLDMDESYQLFITNEAIEISAKNQFGAMAALASLWQLLAVESGDFVFLNCEINDKPRFKWRGVMIDLCRHFIGFDVIKRQIDAMAMVKLNVLHLHLSDDQGYAIQSKQFPKLNEGNGPYLTHIQIKELIAHGKRRGVRIIPEIDVPSHATSILRAYPEFGAAQGPYETQRQYGIFNPSLNVTDDRVMNFLELLFKEIAELFEDDFIHIGGDENNGKDWLANENIVNFMADHQLKDAQALQAFFNTKLLTILTSLGKKMQGWDEIFHKSLPKDIVVQSWQGGESLHAVAKAGYQGLLSHNFYIDMVQNPEHYYLNEPFPDGHDLTSKEEKSILGGEATIWSEIITEENIESRLWPNCLALAERLWSPKKYNDVAEFYPRMMKVNQQLESVGINHIGFQQTMLRSIAEGESIDDLLLLMQVIKPLDGYRRHHDFKFKRYYPFTRLADACFSYVPARFKVNQWLDDQDESELLNWLKQFEGLGDRLSEKSLHNPKLKTAALLAGNWQVMVELLINVIENGVNHSSLGELEQLFKPVEQVELLMVQDLAGLLGVELADNVVLNPKAGINV